jgi:adenylate cyclase class IV
MAFTAELHATMDEAERGRRLHAVYEFLLSLDIGSDAGGAPGVEIEADSQTEQPERHKEMSNAVRAEGVRNDPSRAV